MISLSANFSGSVLGVTYKPGYLSWEKYFENPAVRSECCYSLYFRLGKIHFWKWYYVTGLKSLAACLGSAPSSCATIPSIQTVWGLIMSHLQQGIQETVNLLDSVLEKAQELPMPFCCSVRPDFHKLQTSHRWEGCGRRTFHLYCPSRSRRSGCSNTTQAVPYKCIFPLPATSAWLHCTALAWMDCWNSHQ